MAKYFKDSEGQSKCEKEGAVVSGEAPKQE